MLGSVFMGSSQDLKQSGNANATPQHQISSETPIMMSTYYGQIPTDANGVHRYIRARQNFTYEGQFKDGHIHGKGVSWKTVRDSNSNTVKRGRFDKGFFVEGELVCNDHIYFGKFIGNDTLHDPDGYIRFLKTGVSYRGNVIMNMPDHNTDKGVWTFQPLSENSPTLINQRTDYTKKDCISFEGRYRKREYLYGVYYGVWVHNQPNGVGLFIDEQQKHTYIGLFRNGEPIKAVKFTDNATYRGLFKNWMFNDANGIIEQPDKVYIGNVVSGLPQGTGKYHTNMWNTAESIKNFDPEGEEVATVDKVTDEPIIKALLVNNKLHIPENTFGRYQIQDVHGKIVYIGDVFYGKFHGIGFRKSKKGYKVGLFVNNLLVKGELKYNNHKFKGRYIIGTDGKEELSDPNGEIHYLNHGFIYRGPVRDGAPDFDNDLMSAATITLTKSLEFIDGPFRFKINSGTLNKVPDGQTPNFGPIDVKDDDPTIESLSVNIDVAALMHDYLMLKKEPFDITKIKFLDGCVFTGLTNVCDKKIYACTGVFTFPDGDKTEIMSRWDSLQTEIFLKSMFNLTNPTFYSRIESKNLVGRDLVELLNIVNNPVPCKWPRWWMQVTTDQEVYDSMGITDKVNQIQFKNCLK